MTVLSPTVKANPRVYPEGARKSGTNSMAVASLITAVLLFPVPVISLFTGGIAMSQIRRNGQRGLTMAAIGATIGAIGSAAWIAFWLVVLAYKGVSVSLPNLPF